MNFLFLDVDEYLGACRIADLKRALGDAEMAGLNTDELSGSRVDATVILNHARTMPFLAERRLIIVRDYLSHLDKRMAASQSAGSAAYGEARQFLEALPELPDTSDLVLVDEGLDKRRHLWRGFTATGKEGSSYRVPGLADLIEQGQIRLEVLAAPEPRALPGWIQRQARDKQIDIDGQAVQMLANFVGPNLRQLDNELEKLAAYAGRRRVNADDVRLLVSDASEALIWDLTDALSQRNGRQAMRTLQELRRGDANPFYLLAMVARQYRIMIKVKEALRSSHDKYAIAKRVGEKLYPVQKAMQQCRQYPSAELDEVMLQLLEADYAMKTGADPETTIDVLVAELTRK